MSEKRHLYEKRQKKQFAEICGATGKRMFSTHEGALLFAGNMNDPRRDTPMEWRAYLCKYCQEYHLTSQPLRTYARVN
jgi:hypothetical protein